MAANVEIFVTEESRESAISLDLISFYARRFLLLLTRGCVDLPCRIPSLPAVCVS